MCVCVSAHLPFTTEFTQCLRGMKMEYQYLKRVRKFAEEAEKDERGGRSVRQEMGNHISFISIYSRFRFSHTNTRPNLNLSWIG